MPPIDVPWPPMYLVAECTDDVGAVVEDAAVDRRRRGVVDDQRQALRVRGVGPGARGRRR